MSGARGEGRGWILSKTALITGITGQDGAYLAELLLAKGYFVHGIKRRASSFNTDRIDHLYQDPHEQDVRLRLHYGDLTDSTNLIRIIQEVQPDEIYNLAAQSHVAVSFETPEYTANSDAIGTLRLLEAVRILGPGEKNAVLPGLHLRNVRQGAGDSAARDDPVLSPFPVRCGEGVRLLDDGQLSRGLWSFACNGILFNHESPMRGETFVSRKITRALTRIHVGLQDSMHLGNLDARRDWGHARDYVRAQWLMLQQAIPEDFVIATGSQFSVRDFVIAAGALLGMKLEWRGEGVDETGVDASTGRRLCGWTRVTSVPPRSRRCSAIRPKHARSWDGPRRPHSPNWLPKWWKRISRSRGAMPWSRNRGIKSTVITSDEGEANAGL